jgi:hypothetical protein
MAVASPGSEAPASELVSRGASLIEVPKPELGNEEEIG